MTDPLPPGPLDVPACLAALTHGSLEVVGRLVDASNTTLLCRLEHEGQSAQAIYKPRRGERPLWDFPRRTLADRERAAFLVSAATGWDVVPPTVLRDGPFGEGMVQWWVDVEEDVDLYALVQSDDPRLRRISVLDSVINNADRKGSHVLPVAGGHLYGVDHGVTFHVEDKLRTVLWQWRGQRLTAEARETLRALAHDLDGALDAELAGLLSAAERRALAARVERLLQTGRHPRPSGDWPALPWPPF